MKKFLSLLLAYSLFALNSCVLATEILDKTLVDITQEQPQQEELIVHDDAPIWEEYVAPKYRNPRSDFSRGASISELVVGIVLTELIITSPIGIPMTVHGATKVKMISYNNRKNIFDEEIAKAKLIQNDDERIAEYKRILKRCHLKESTREHYAQKRRIHESK